MNNKNAVMKITAFFMSIYFANEVAKAEAVVLIDC